MRIRLFLFVALVVGQTCWGQNPEYDFYPEFRNVVAPKFYLANPGLSFKDVVARYVADLRAQGIDSTEIARRERLILESKPALDADYWDRFYLAPTSKVNRGPNAFLVEMMRNRTPGVALTIAADKLSISPCSVGLSIGGWGYSSLAVNNPLQTALAQATTSPGVAFDKRSDALIVFGFVIPFNLLSRGIGNPQRPTAHGCCRSKSGMPRAKDQQVTGQRDGDNP